MRAKRAEKKMLYHKKESERAREARREKMMYQKKESGVVDT